MTKVHFIAHDLIHQYNKEVAQATHANGWTGTYLRSCVIVHARDGETWHSILEEYIEKTKTSATAVSEPMFESVRSEDDYCVVNLGLGGFNQAIEMTKQRSGASDIEAAVILCKELIAQREWFKRDHFYRFLSKLNIIKY